MPKIVINSCQHTANYLALEAISEFMRSNRKTSPYEHEKIVHLKDGVSYEVKELPMDVNRPTCSCTFEVKKVHEFNRIN